MRTELPGLRAPVTGSTKETGRAIAETLAANGAEVAIDGSNKADDVEPVNGEIRGTVPSGRFVRASGDAAGGADILFKNVGT
jgi:NAD(P)-dependent dehydrogenase (short-subunit alcohol dehydrogenase family)